MARPNYRISPEHKKNNPFFESVRKLLSAKEQEEREEIQEEEMEEGFVKTKPREAHENSEYTEQQQAHETYENRGTHESYENGQDDTNTAKQGVVLSTSACITAFVTILALVGFAFLFGLIIGKGMTPAVKKDEPVPLTANIKEENAKPVLPKEELQFMTSLKKEPEKKTAEQIAAEQEAEKKANEERLKAKAEAQQQAEKKAETLANAGKKFDYDIRVAAFRNEGQADDLRLKLEADGFRTKKNVKKDNKGSWFFVHVLMIGTEERLKESQERFKKFGVRDIIVENKVEVK